MLHIPCGQCGGGLIQDDELCLQMHRLADLEDLLLAGCKILHHRLGIDVHLKLLKEIPRLSDHLLLPQLSEAGCLLPSNEEVLVDPKVVEQVQLLMDERNAGVLGLPDA